MRTRAKKWAVLTAGWAFILLGVVGLFLPILQGILFLLIGLIILSSEYVWAHRLLEKIRRRFPKVAQQSHAATEKARAWLHRIHGSKEPSASPRQAAGNGCAATGADQAKSD